MHREKLHQKEELQALVMYTDKITMFGLWQNNNQVDNELDGLRTKSERKEALETQVRFRQKVLHHGAPSHLYIPYLEKME